MTIRHTPNPDKGSLWHDAVEHIEENWNENEMLGPAEVEALADQVVECFDNTEYWNQMDRLISQSLSDSQRSRLNLNVATTGSSFFPEPITIHGDGAP